MKFVSCSLALLATFVAGTHAAWNEDLSSHNAIAKQWTKAKISNAPGLTVIPTGNHAA
jgi:hypothetical protein